VNWRLLAVKNLGENDTSRHNSSNDSGFGRDVSKWVGKKTVLPSNVLNIAVVGKNMNHPAVFPVDLPLFFIKLLCPPDGLVVDPFSGSGTSGVAALSAGRKSIMIDNNEEYHLESVQRLRKASFDNLNGNGAGNNVNEEGSHYQDRLF